MPKSPAQHAFPSPSDGSLCLSLREAGQTYAPWSGLTTRSRTAGYKQRGLVYVCTFMTLSIHFCLVLKHILPFNLLSYRKSRFVISNTNEKTKLQLVFFKCFTCILHKITMRVSVFSFYHAKAYLA